MKKFLSIILAALLVLSTASVALADPIQIGVPNDTTNEARALLLLEANGVIDLDDAAGITATIRDIISQPENIEFVEIEAAQLPNLLPDLDYAIINNNYAISFGLNPVADSLLIEGAFSAYSNILCVKEGNETAPATLALVAALSSKQVADFIADKYDGAVVSVVAEPGDGYDASIDYAALAGTTITVAASPTPHAEILKVAAEVLAKDGWTLDIKEYTDYVQPNLVVDDGELDANYFQHVPYLETFNADNGTKLVSVAMIHYEPFGIYAGTKSAIADLSEGDKIAVPNDGSNRARALLLLEQEGIIQLKEGVGMDATDLDIVGNPLNLEIFQMEAAQIANVRDSVALAVINGNYALQAGLNAGTDALAVEDAESISATTYANVLVVKAGNENSEKVQALVNALKSDAVKTYINDTYSGAVVPIF